MEITESDIETFNRDGVLPLRQAVSAEELEMLEDVIERDIANPGPFYHGYESDDGGRFHGNLRLWQTYPELKKFCFESALPRIAGEIMQSNKINLLYDQLFVKEKRTSNPTRWHNDQPYWAVRGWQVLSMWIALDVTTLESGALEFIKGSHKWDRWFQPEAFGKTSGFGDYERNPDYEPMPDIDGNRDQYDIVTWDLQPGDVYLFHAMTVHGSPGNLSNTNRRRGYTVRYTGDDIVYDTRPGTNAGLHNDKLEDGMPLDSDMFPVVINGR